MIETPKTINEWSEQVFPALEEESQKKKLIEELIEYIKSKTDADKIKELADIYIVSSILRERFNSDLGFMAFRGIFTVDMIAVYPAVDEKMKINRSRIWEFKNGVYHHKEVKDE
jgi:hypothetical protein